MNDILQVPRRKLFDYKYRLLHPVYRPKIIDNKQAVTSRITTGCHVAMVCHGNINRSPFAERYLKNKSTDLGIDLTVTSFGMANQEGRSCPKTAISVAKEFDVDLTGHTSSSINKDTYESFDLVLVTDTNVLARIRNIFSKIPTNTYYLGAFSDEYKYSIPDPDGKDADYYLSVFSQIANSIDSLCKVNHEK